MRKGLILSLALAAACAGCATVPPKSPVDVAKVNALMVMPPAAFPKSEYSQFYKLVRIGGVDDLPFSTGVDVKLRRPLWAWAVLLVRANTEAEVSPLKVLKADEEVPLAVHQGCKIVNVVADVRTGRTLSSWCNVGSSIDGDPMKVEKRDFSDPNADPLYFAPGSPFRL